MSVDMSEKRKGKTPPKGLGACRVSTVKSARQVDTTEHQLEDIRNWIVEGKGKFASTITAIRATEDDEKQSELKRSLPAVMFSGTFRKRSSKELIQHSGLICMDFDKVERPDQIIDNMRFDPHLALAFISPRGNGVKAVFCIPDDSEQAEAFETVRDYCATMYELEADESGKDVSRLCFLSVDPEAHYAPDAVPLKVAPKIEMPQKPQKAATEGDRIGNRYEASADIYGRSTALLTAAGWKVGRSAGDKTFCTRPGKERGVSGTLWSDGGFYCFSDQAAPLEPSKGYSAFGLYGTLEHGADFKAAAQALAEEFGEPASPRMSGRDFYGKDLPVSGSVWDNLRAENLANKIDDMKKKKRETVYLIEGIAPIGQATVIYAAPNTGKTLIAINEIASACKAHGHLQVFYLNADDTFDGLIEKALVAKEAGFAMVAPGVSDFRVEDLVPILEKAVDDDEVDGMALVLDTLKKFADLMDKKQQRVFTATIRRFVQAGGTVLALAHANKNKTGDGKSVPEGTGDVVNDFDCVHVIELKTPQDDPNRMVEFRNVKLRGPVKLKKAYRYNAGPDLSWRDRFDSVEGIEGTAARAEVEAVEHRRKYDEDKFAVLEICELIESGITQKTKICNSVSRCGRDAARRVLECYDQTHLLPGMRVWEWRIGEANNEKCYQLSSGKPKI